MFTVQGQPLLGVVLAFFCGALAGFVTALLQTKLGVQPILAGIITMTALYSVNLMVMGKPNINFFKEKTIFTAAEAMPGGFGSLLQAAAITAVLCVLLVLFLRTQLGLSLRADVYKRQVPVEVLKENAVVVNEETAAAIGVDVSKYAR